MRFPKGTIIRVGQNKKGTIAHNALGVEFELNRDYGWGEHVMMAKVTKDLRGKWGRQITHKLDEYADMVVFHPHGTNKQAAAVLDKEW